MYTPDKKAGPAVRAVSLETLRNVWDWITIAGGKAGKIKDTNPYSATKEQAIAEVNMYLIKDQLVLPLSRGKGVSFAEKVGGGKPTYFVSHNWKGKFKNFLAAVEAHFKSVQATNKSATPEKTYYWVCTFANNQFEPELGATKLEDFPFAKAIDLVSGAGNEIVAI